jgi:hypothetical protein
MDNCIICYEEYTIDNMHIILDCNHKLCLICYEKILTKKTVLCPICRNIIEKHTIINVSPDIINILSDETNRVRKYIILVVGIIIIILIIIFVFLRNFI